MKLFLKPLILALLMAFPALAQIPVPQINLTGNIGAQGFPVLNSGTLQFTSDANHTMTAQETSATGGIKVTSTVSLTATRNLILPAGNFQFIAVENATTGGQSIQVIGQTGTGITIPNGNSATVWFDGTNVVQTGSSSSVAPGGTTGAGQYNNAGAFGGVNGTGYFYLNGASAPTAAHPFSSTPGGVYNTSADASRNMTGTDINTILGYTPATGPNFTSDFVACYLFLETPTSGGSLPDHCGNNTGVVGTVAPTTDGVGWRWTFSPTATSGVVLPAALNSAKTYYFTVSIPPALVGNYVSPQIQTMLGGVLAGGLDINASNGSGVFQPFGGFDAFVNGTTTVNTANIFNGLAILTLVCNPTGPDTLYFDGHLTANSATTTSCGAMTGSNQFQIGASADSSNFALNGELYDLRVSNNSHTASQVAQNVAALTNEMVGRGVSFLPSTYQNPSQQLFFTGDSITCGFNAGGSPPCTPQANPWVPGLASSFAFPNHLTLDQTFGIQNFGASGARIQNQLAAAPQIYAPYCQTTHGQSIAVLFEGTNNAGFTTPADTWVFATAWAKLMHTAGCKAIYIGMISRGGTYTGMGGGTYEDFRYAYNAAARANWKQAGFDAFVDSDADPFMGCTGCNANTTYFTSDLTHPTAAGQLKLALEVQQAINYVSDGSTPDNPNPAVITAATYSLTGDDGGLIFDTASNNIVATMLSAQWQTGRIVQVCNTSTSGTNTLTIDAPADYPFDNVTGSTTVAVANNTCQQFQATYVQGGATNGDFWRVL